ncbi:hypothetical protein BGX28_005352 [Mortierella sp. GBA30]|nr:hypothetical protein BGX28_005352 [Mortierella sp. GBA30]
MTCRLGLASRVHRRLSDIERQSVRSGSVYCFDEREAGMRRWTDGKSWSPSRVTGTFLTYRELDDAQGSHGNKNVYRPNGLLKQSFSITTSDNQKLHLISYYTNDEVGSERLRNTPSQDPRFAEIVLPKGIYPEMAIPVADQSTSQTSPSPPMPNRKHRPHHRAFQQQSDDDHSSLRVDARPVAPAYQQHRRNGSSSSSHSGSGHRRTNSGSSSLKEHRYSPIQVPEGKHIASRSRSNSNLAVYSSSAPRSGISMERDQRYRSSSPSTAPLFPAPAYSPNASWASDDDQTMVAESIGAQESLSAGHPGSVMIPALRELPPLHRGHESKLKDRSQQPHEQDSLSVLANLATHTLLLPKLEPKEVSGEKSRWVEDDRQLRALSTMLRL